MKQPPKKRIKTVLHGKARFEKFKIETYLSEVNAAYRKIHFKKNLSKTAEFIQKKPFTSFFAVLAIFFLLMLIGNIFFAPKVQPLQNVEALKQVHIYKLGSAPQVQFEGIVNKSGVIQIVAQTSGIVQNINVSEGEHIGAGTNILSLSTNYSGGNTLTLARQSAQAQYENAQSIYQQQGDIIGKQKDLANKNNDNTTLLRQIAAQSASDTQALYNLNKTITDSIEQSIQNLEASNVNGSNDTAILQAKEQISQFQSAMAQTNSSLANLELQASPGEPPAQIAQDQHDIAVEQLDIQRKALDLNLDLSKLQYEMAVVNEQNMFPSSPFAGTVDKIFVKTGQNVNSGTILASISGDNQHVEIDVNVPEGIAKNISNFEPSTLTIGKENIKRMPDFISKDATDGNLYTVIFQLGNSFVSSLTNDSYINVNIPIGTANTSNEAPFIPLDAVVQTQESSFVYVVGKNNTAQVRDVTLGQIQGQYVEVTSGLPAQSEVILDRNVIEGDRIQIIR